MLYKKNVGKRKRHKCWRCGTTYTYILGKTSNTYEDSLDDSDHYDCPKCGKEYYPPFQDIFVLGNIIRNLL